MAVSNAPITFADLYTALLNRLRADSSNSATLNQAKQYICLANNSMHLGFGEKYPWCERKATLLTQASYSTGTLSVSVGGTSVTGASTLWNTNNDYGVANVRAGGKLVLEGSPDIYEVASVSSDTALTLATRYVGSAALSGATYTYFEDEYDLAADFLKPIDANSFDTDRQIELISRTDFRRMFPRPNVTGTIERACIIDKISTGAATVPRRVRFHRPPSTTIIIPYAYVTKYLAISSAGTAAENLSSDDDQPIVPQIYRHAIVLQALADWYRDKKDDQRSQEVQADFTNFMLRVTADGDIAQPRMKLQPRVGGYRRQAARPYSGAGQRYDTNGRFDRMER